MIIDELFETVPYSIQIDIVSVQIAIWKIDEFVWDNLKLLKRESLDFGLREPRDNPALVLWLTLFDFGFNQLDYDVVVD